MAGAPAGYRTFAAGEVLTAANVQTYLQDQVIPVYADAAAADAALASPAEGQFRILNDSDSFQRYDGSAWVNAGGGAAGSVLQVVSTTKTDTFSASVATGGLVSVTGLTASITPSSTSSTILVFVAIDGSASTADGHMSFRLMRGVSPVGVGDTAGSRTSLTASQTPAYASDNTALANAMKQFLDTPATISSTTYSVEIHNSTGGSQTLYVNRSGADLDNAARVRTISTITLMEVAG